MRVGGNGGVPGRRRRGDDPRPASQLPIVDHVQPRRFLQGDGLAHSAVLRCPQFGVAHAPCAPSLPRLPQIGRPQQAPDRVSTCDCWHATLLLSSVCRISTLSLLHVPTSVTLLSLILPRFY